MKKYINQIENILKSNKELNENNLIKETFINTNMIGILEDSLYLLPSTHSYVYILNNISNRMAHTFIVEYFKNMLKVQEKFPNEHIKFFLVENNEILSFNTYLNSIPSSMEKYSPDFDYILEEIKNLDNLEIKKEIKLKVFLEMLKFISQDEDLTLLTKMLLKD